MLEFYTFFKHFGDILFLYIIISALQKTVKNYEMTFSSTITYSESLGITLLTIRKTHEVPIKTRSALILPLMIEIEIN